MKKETIKISDKKIELEDLSDVYDEEEIICDYCSYSRVCIDLPDFRNNDQQTSFYNICLEEINKNFPTSIPSPGSLEKIYSNKYFYYCKIYFYSTIEGYNGGIEKFTYYFIQFETIILKVKSLDSILRDDIVVSVLRPDVYFIKNLESFSCRLNIKKIFEKINTNEEVRSNVKYLLRNVEHELKRISGEG